MKKIYQLLGFEAAHTKGLKFGVEVEMEGVGAEQPHQAWEVKVDRSLRDGYEFVFQAPLSLPESLKAVQGLYSGWRALGITPSPSFRCSTHVHVNVQEWTIEEVKAAVFAYSLYEHEFMRNIHPDRTDNRFAVSGADSAYFEHNPLWDNDIRIDPNTYKYASLNTATLQQFGTLEFRSLHASKTPGIVLQWITTLAYFMTNVRAFGNIEGVRQAYLNDPTALNNILVHETWRGRSVNTKILERNYSSMFFIMSKGLK